MLTCEEPVIVTDVVDNVHMTLYALFVEVALRDILAFAVPVYGAIC